MKIGRFFFSATVAFSLVACSDKKPMGQMNNEELKKYADVLSHQYIITDTHIDLPERLLEEHFQLEPESMGELINTTKGDFDFERAKKGGLDAPFMSIYIPSPYQLKSDKGKILADSLINMVEWIVNAIPDKFALAGTPADIKQNFKAGKISLPMGMENGAPIGNDLKNIQYFYDRGIRYVTLTHAKDNQICDSSYDTTATWNGLSPFGHQVVEEMNRIGMMVDISHVSDSAFYQVLRISNVPVIASHSSCRYFTPGFWRNMSDDMIKKLGENGGVIQINFGSSFLDSASLTHHKINLKKLAAILSEKNLKAEDPLAKPIVDQFQKDNPALFANVKRVADHIDHVVKLIGVDHVGFGSDFDGVGDSLPTGLKDVSMYPNLIYELLKRGYVETDIEKICGGNVLRVWQQIQDATKTKS